MGLGFGGALLASAVLWAGSTPAAESGGPVVLRIGLVGTLFRDTSEPLVQIMMRPFKSLMEMQTGVTSELVLGGDAGALGQKLSDEEVQLAVFHGFEFAWARARHPELKPLIIAVNQRPYLQACLVVRGDGKVADYKDLHGKVLALPKQSREHCRLYLERRCVEPGQAADRYFAQVTTPHDFMDAIDDVIDGTVQGAVVDATDLAAYRKQKPNRGAKLKVLQESELFPCAVVAYKAGTLSDDQLTRFRDGMIASNRNPQGKQLLSLCRITSFEAVPDDYERLLNEIVKAYPPPATAK